MATLTFPAGFSVINNFFVSGTELVLSPWALFMYGTVYYVLTIISVSAQSCRITFHNIQAPPSVLPAMQVDHACHISMKIAKGSFQSRSRMSLFHDPWPRIYNIVGSRNLCMVRH